MEAPNWYFDVDQIDDELMLINDHLLEIAEIECDFSQLVDVLYDTGEKIKPDVVHGLITDLCKKLDIQIPKRQSLKIE